MAEEGAAALDDSEDVDVIWEGSPLHEHMKQLGLESPDGDVAAKGRLIDARSRPSPADLKPGKAEFCMRIFVKLNECNETLPGRRRGKRDVSAWPSGVSGAHVEIEIAQKLLSSELLVQEDEDFISNFILTDEALDQHQKRLKAIADGSGEAR